MKILKNRTVALAVGLAVVLSGLGLAGYALAGDDESYPVGRVRAALQHVRIEMRADDVDKLDFLANLLPSLVEEARANAEANRHGQRDWALDQIVFALGRAEAALNEAQDNQDPGARLEAALGRFEAATADARDVIEGLLEKAEEGDMPEAAKRGLQRASDVLDAVSEGDIPGSAEPETPDGKPEDKPEGPPDGLPENAPRGDDDEGQDDGAPDGAKVPEPGKGDDPPDGKPDDTPKGPGD